VQDLAGELLLRHEVPPPRTLDTLLDELLPTMNASVGRTAAYLARCFGREAVLAEVMGRYGPKRTAQDARLDCVRYWLGEHPRAPR
jgi:hypothetical protein